MFNIIQDFGIIDFCYDSNLILFFSLHTFWLEHMNKDQSPRIKSWSMVFGLSEYRNPAPSERPEKFPIEN